MRGRRTAPSLLYGFTRPNRGRRRIFGGGVLVDEGVLYQSSDSGPGIRCNSGQRTFRVLGALRRVPGDTLVVATLAPKIYLAARDPPSTGLLQAGSLARYRFHPRLPPGQDVEALVGANGLRNGCASV
ncbi:MAG: hypothetical protein KIT22_02905 [Verrucomicrobiae bacterium]|nr:hypothetical protein [Verrucomicrobiae bacterium]